MQKLNKSITILLMALPPLVWGVITYVCIIIYTNFEDPIWREYISRLLWPIRTIIFLHALAFFYKKLIPRAYLCNQKLFFFGKIISLGVVIFAVFSKNLSVDYIIYGVIFSPIVEELCTHFVLFDAKNRGLKFYSLVSIFTALTFTIMHFGYYDYYSFSFATVQILQESAEHFIFALGLSAVFFFIPRLEILILIHAALNIPYIWQRFL